MLQCVGPPASQNICLYRVFASNLERGKREGRGCILGPPMNIGVELLRQRNICREIKSIYMYAQHALRNTQLDLRNTFRRRRKKCCGEPFAPHAKKFYGRGEMP